MTNWVEEMAKELSKNRLEADEKEAIKIFLRMAAGKDEHETWFLANRLHDTLIDLWNLRVPQ
jgi:hypothetical protein